MVKHETQWKLEHDIMTSFLFSTFDILRSISGFSGFSEASVGDSIQEEAEEGGNRGEWMGCIAAVLDGNKLKMMQPFLLVPRSWGNKQVVVWIHFGHT